MVTAAGVGRGGSEGQGGGASAGARLGSPRHGNSRAGEAVYCLHNNINLHTGAASTARDNSDTNSPHISTLLLAILAVNVNCQPRPPAGNHKGGRGGRRGGGGVCGEERGEMLGGWERGVVWVIMVGLWWCGWNV